MKRITKALAVLAAVTAIALSALSVSAEDTTEPVTEPAVTTTAEETTEPTTSAAETTESETTVQTTVTTAPTETTTAEATRPHGIILFESGPVFDPNWKSENIWTEGTHTRTFDLTSYNYESEPHIFGDFCGLFCRGKEIESDCYSVEYDRDKSITFTFNENFRKKHEEGSYWFTVEFENMTMRGWFEFVLASPRTADKNTGSPKTGDKGVSLASSLLLLSGAGVLISRKRKN